jgi:vitamin B12 transporter
VLTPRRLWLGAAAITRDLQSKANQLLSLLKKFAMTRTAFAPWAALLSARPARLSPLFIAIASLAMTSACMQAQAQANPTSAASTELAAGRIVTTPARVPQGLDAAIPNTTVITREAISQAGNISLVELLRRHSRLEAVALGPYASLQGVAARGGSGGRVLFLLDGVPLSDSGAAAAVALGATGNNDIARAAIDQIPLSSIERIEVSVGSLSAVYGGEGADAVVNIFSRVERAFRPRERKPASLQLDGQLGSDSLRAGTAHATTSSVDTQIAATVGATRLNPGSVSNANALGYNPDRDPQKQVFGMLKLSQNLMQGEHLSLTLIGVKGEQDVDLRGSLALPGSVQPLSEERVERQLQIAKLTSHTYFSPQWRSRIEVSRQFDKSDYLGRVEQSVRATRDVATWINELGIVGGKLIAGVEVKRDKVSILNNNINALTQPEMTQVGAFIGVRERASVTTV